MAVVNTTKSIKDSLRRPIQELAPDAIFAPIEELKRLDVEKETEQLDLFK